MDHADTPAFDSGAHPAVECDGVVIRYGTTVAVDRLTFRAQRGEVLALLGPNGAGKTSCVEALEGYRPIADGTARVLGLDPHRDHAALVPRIGVMLQKGGIYPMLCPAQLLHLFAAYYDDPEDPDRLLDEVGLGDARRTPWRRLSGGEQQRLSLALALVGKPDVLFLDEPTAGVDPEGRVVVRELICAQRDKGVCVLMTTHELGEAERVADRVVIIDHGRLLAEGSPAELASGAADATVRFSTDAGIDCAALAAAIGSGASVDEERPGSYRLQLGPGAASPPAVAALASWLSENHLAIGDLRTGKSLEEAYLAITGARGDPEPEPEGTDAAGRGRRSRRRR